jgi:hypothetical protein
MITEINQHIKAGVVFDNNNVKPKWFIWNNRKYIIKKITYTWKTNQGEAILIHFSVTDGATLFELCMNQKNLEWTLEKVSTE